MPGFLSNLLQGAAAGRGAYLEGQREGEEDRKQEEDRQRRIREEMVRMSLLDLKKKQAEKDLSAPEPGPTVNVSAGRPGGRVSGEFGRDDTDAIKGFLDTYGADEAGPTTGQRAYSASQERLRGNDERQRTLQAAKGDARTWVRASLDPEFTGQGMDRKRILQLLRAQHGLGPGEASQVYEEALRDQQVSKGRDLLNRDRASGDEDPLKEAMAEVLREGGESTPGPGVPRNPLGSGRAVAAPAGGEQSAPDINPDMAAQIDADLAANKSPEEILADIREAGLPASVVEQAEAYLSTRGGGGGY